MVTKDMLKQQIGYNFHNIVQLVIEALSSDNEEYLYDINGFLNTISDYICGDGADDIVLDDEE